MTDHEDVLAGIDSDYLQLCDCLDTVDLCDKLAIIKRLAEEAVLHPCSRQKAVEIWKNGNR